MSDASKTNAPAVTAPIEIEMTVAAPVADAFRVFTTGIDEWWPVEMHSIGEERVAEVVLEPRAGGRIFERWDDGEERDWAQILEWDEPNHLVLSWSPNPGRPTPTEVDVTFSPEGAGTRVRLEHRGWERLGEEAEEARTSYKTGWPPVLELFARSCDAADAPAS